MTMNNIADKKKRTGRAADMRSEKVTHPTPEREIDTSFDQQLRHVDIVTAIRYYGITELLDHIGHEELEWYLRYR